MLLWEVGRSSSELDNKLKAFASTLAVGVPSRIFFSGGRVHCWSLSISEVHSYLTKAMQFEKALVPPLSLLVQQSSCL